MTEAPTNVIPETLLKQLQAMEDTDAKAKVAEIRLFLDDFSKLTSYLRKAPERVTYFEMVSITPETTTRLFGDPLMGLGYALESVSAGWTYSHIFKLRAYCEGLLSALEKSNLLVAALCSRAIFEHAAFFHYFFEKVERNFLAEQKLVGQQKKRILSGKTPPKEWMEKWTERRLGHISLCLRALDASDFDWKQQVSKLLGEEFGKELGSKTEQFDTSAQRGKVHINDCIRRLNKLDPEFENRYGALCELVHPNKGSHLLTIEKRVHREAVVFDTTLSDSPVGLEAHLFLLLFISDALHDITKLTHLDIVNANRVMKHYQETIMKAEKRRRKTVPTHDFSKLLH